MLSRRPPSLGGRREASIFLVDEIRARQKLPFHRLKAGYLFYKSEYLVNNVTRNFIERAIETIPDLTRDRYFMRQVKIFPLNH